MRRRVALFGGSFNPPHVAHQLVALYVLETEPIDELWLIPCFMHPFDKALESFEDRLWMCRLAALPLGPRAAVSDCEKQLGGESRTLRTVKSLLSVHPDIDLSLVIGADLETEVSSWYGADELRELVRFIVVPRTGYGKISGEPNTRPAMPAISSTDIRERLRRGYPVDALVPRSVLDYIHQRKLYGASP